MQSDNSFDVTPEQRGAVLVLWVDNPPVNALGHAVRSGLAEGIVRANADTAVRAVAILARGRTFPAGADIWEFGKPPQALLLPDLCNTIEASAKPAGHAGADGCDGHQCRSGVGPQALVHEPPAAR